MDKLAIDGGRAVRTEAFGDWPIFGLSLIHISEPTRPY